MRYFKKLVGDRIYLSPRNIEDVQLFTKWLNDCETTDYIGIISNLMTLTSEKKYLEEHSGDEKVFSIVTENEDKMIGTVCLENINSVNRTATLGVFIGDKEYRSKGYGTEAIKLILDFGFRYLNLNNIKLDVLEFNARAIACYKKCGFKEYGRRRQAVFLNGKYYDRISMDILSDEFNSECIKNKNI